MEVNMEIFLWNKVILFNEKNIIVVKIDYYYY